MKNVEKLIPKAWNVLRERFKDGKIPKPFNGYVSSFGASLRQSGLLPTVAFFENKSENTEATRSDLPKLILALLKGSTFNEAKNATLMEYVMTNKDDKGLKRKIEEASIAIKLTMRSFEMIKE